MTKKSHKISFASKVLDMHFAYTGKIVDCNVAKSFLPILADQDLSISIPTPITVHLENCPQCQKDLKSLVKLDLRKDQLYVLCQLFSQANNETTLTECIDPSTVTVLFAAMDFTLLSPEALKHISLCGNCRHRVTALREDIIKQVNANSSSNVCNMQFRDLFETCFPYSRTPQEIPGESALDTVHAKACGECLTRANTLTEVIGEIRNRENSGIATRLSLKDNVDEKRIASKGYEEWPVNVEVFEIEQPKLAQNNSTNKKANYRLFPSKYLKTASIAAAFSLVFILFFNNKNASAISLDEVLVALDNVTDIRIAKHRRGDPVPSQTILMSKTKKIRILDDEYETVIFDLNSGLRTVKNKDDESVVIDKMNNDLIARVEKGLNRNWGIIPKDITNSSWKNITHEMDQVPKHGEVYELSIVTNNKTGAIRVSRLWIDTRSSLPYSIDVYTKSTPKSILILREMFQIDYLTVESSIESILNKINASNRHLLP